MRLTEISIRYLDRGQPALWFARHKAGTEFCVLQRHIHPQFHKISPPLATSFVALPIEWTAERCDDNPVSP